MEKKLQQSGNPAMGSGNPAILQWPLQDSVCRIGGGQNYCKKLL
jgi:hypothetical protein